MHSRRRGLLLPLVGWGVASALLFLWQFHRTQARTAALDFTVLKEGGDELDTAEVTLDGRRYLAGMPCGLGWKHLVFQAEGFERLETNRFVGYGGLSLGEITLVRVRGRMELELSPAIRSVRITGSGETKTLTNVTRESLSLPVGQYTVLAKFARFSVERTVIVARNQTSRVDIAPTLTALSLTSEPDSADFELISKGSPLISSKGTTPRLLTELPTGDYELRMSRGAYQKNLPVSLTGTKGTNEVKVEFVYAKLSINSEPPDAAISEGSRVVGRTPASFELPPGAYRIQIAKDGYFATNVDLTLSETDSRTVSVTLANVSFAEALERARRRSFGGVNNDLALADLEEALRIKPGDEAALMLKRQIESDQHLRKAWLLERKGAFAEALSEVNAVLKLDAGQVDALAMKKDLEKAVRTANEQRAKVEQEAAVAKAEARRKHPEKVMQDTARHLLHQELFQNQLVRCNGSPDSVRAAVLRALERKPAWSVIRDDKPDAETVVLLADARGFGWKQRVVLVAGQVAENEVAVWFKLLSFTADAAYLSQGGFKPTHPRYASQGRAGMVEEYLRKDTEAFRKRLQEELR